MKLLPILSVPVLGVFLTACDTINRPLGGSGDFDPLNAPGGGTHANVVDANSNSFHPGQFVKTAMDNAAFFKQRPKGDADADRLLKANTPMKVVSTDGSYIKVELDSGEVGYVPSVMAVDQSSVDTPMSGAMQVAPLPPGATPKDPVPESGTPSEGAIPTSIDPEAPATAPKKDAPADAAPTGAEVNPAPKKALKNSSSPASKPTAA